MRNRKATRRSMGGKMALIATLYYRQHMSQQMIADKLNLSRPWVSKLLARAEETGIVKIEINSPYPDNAALEDALEKKYKLRHVGVVRRREGEDNVAMAAAEYFLSILRPNDVVGVGWGTSVSRLIDQARTCKFSDVQIVPMAGSFGNNKNFFPNYSAMRLAETLSANAKTLHAPVLCSTQEEYDSMISNPATQEVIDLAEHASILLLGIGTFADSVSPRYGIFQPEDIARLEADHATGDVALQYIDRRGQLIDNDTTRRLIKADICKASESARYSIGIAEGLSKTPTIDSALRMKLVNVLFTDEETGLSLAGF